MPFSSVFEKIRARFGGKGKDDAPASPDVAEPVRPHKAQSDRLSKTVLPSMKRSTVADPYQLSTGAGAVMAASAATVARKPVRGPSPKTPASPGLPRALARALEPKMERAISLQVADFIDQVPSDYIKPIEVIDAGRSVNLKASEIEKGMPECNPSMSLHSLYQQLPEIFLREVAPTDPTRVALPYEKVLKQFSTVRVRTDQVRDARISQVDTPILQTTIEETKRFGGEVKPLETSSLPPVAVEPATAKTLATAEPEPILRETIKPAAKPLHPVISLGGASPQPLSQPDSTPVPPSAEPKSAPAAKIPFRFPPNGTGALASERVPALSGPPVPPISISTPSTPPARIPFVPPGNLAVKPAEKTQPAETPSLPTLPLKPVPAAPPVEQTTGPAQSGAKIALALKQVLQNAPSFQFTGDINAIPEDARVEVALDLIEPQLATGLVIVPARTFQAALPEDYRALFTVDPAETAVALPLQEVLKNLPEGVLKMRPDQEITSLGDEVETPFSLKAKEDAVRFQTPAVSPQPTEKAPVSSPGSAPAQPETEEKIDGKQVVTRASELLGVECCQIMFPDGLSLTGNFPIEIEADALCAMAPALLRRVEAHMAESKMGALREMTLRSAQTAITFFTKPNICLAALHRGTPSLPAETCAQLSELAEKLSRTFVDPEKPHVDH